ncbi:ganglioside GM2 activator [Anabrus simplex]|uniref:ganglioside GM2 activator n=1 Tax=Anabrus simplex TaxID=316456 RepID=UPI0034DDA8B7
MTPFLSLLVVGFVTVVIHDCSCDPKPARGFRVPPGLRLSVPQVKVNHFKIENCGSDSDPARLEDVTVSSKNGAVTVGGSAVITEQLESPIHAKLVILAQPDHVLSARPMTIPCNNGIGSCEYEDLCDFGIEEDDACPSMIKQLGLPCKCPIQPGRYTIGEQTFPLGHLGALATGKYGLLANLTHNDKQVCCYKINFALMT